MYKLAKPIFLTCETSLHAGSGNDLGLIDLPIQRERHTGFPKIEGSGVKGCIKEAIVNKMKDMGCLNISQKDIADEVDMKKAIDIVFGPEREGNKHSGSLGFTDARILLFPVKSMRGVFAWVTCPRVLDRLKKDLDLCNISPGFEVPPEKSVPPDCSLFIKDKRIVLEEFTYEIDYMDNFKCEILTNWLAKNIFRNDGEHKYWQDKVKRDLIILPDDDFHDFVNQSTEVITRIRINHETGTVERKHLFTEEYLPPETVFYTLALATPFFVSDRVPFVQRGEEPAMPEEAIVIDFLRTNLYKVIQMGGNATIGKGLVWTYMP